MKHLIVLAAVLASACSKDPSGMASSSLVGPSAESTHATVSGGTLKPLTAIVGLDYDVTIGPKGGCLSKADYPGEILWEVSIRNAGPGIKTFRRNLYHSDAVMPCDGPGPDSNGRNRITLTNGPNSYLPGASGVTHFAAPADFDGVSCGTNQYDIGIDDGQGHYLTIIGPVLAFDRPCAAPPTPPAPVPQPPAPEPPMPGFPIPEPPGPPMALVCPMPWEILSSGPFWQRAGNDVSVMFTVRADLAGPVHLYLASFHAITEFFLPQQLVATMDRMFKPGAMGIMTVPAVANRVQADLFSCPRSPSEPEFPEDLNDSNIAYWGTREIGAYCDAGICPPDGTAYLRGKR